MKALFIALLTALSLWAEGVSTQDILANKPQHLGGDCSNLAMWALTNTPTTTNPNYYVSGKRDISPEGSVTYYIGKYDGNLEANASTWTAAPQVPCWSDEKTQKEIEVKTNSIVDGLKNRVGAEVSGEFDAAAETIAKTTTNRFTLGYFDKNYQEYAQIIVEAKTWVFIWVMVLALLSVGKSAFAKTFAKGVMHEEVRFESEEVMKRLLMAIAIIWLFWGTSTKPSVGQGLIANAISKGTDWASGVSAFSTKLNINRSIKNAADTLKPEIKAKTAEYIKNQKQIALNQNILAQCVAEYDMTAMNDARGDGNVFPADDRLFYLNGVANTAQRPTDYFGLETCRSSELALKAEVKRQKKLETYYAGLPQRIGGEQTQQTAQERLKTSLNMGWMGVILYPAQQHITAGQESLIGSQINQKPLDNAQFSGHQIGHSFDFKGFLSQFENIDVTRSIDSIGGRVGLLALPGASGIYDSTRNFTKSLIGVIVAPIQGMANVGSKGSVDTWIEAFKDGASNYIAFYVTTGIMQSLVENLPIILITTVGALAVCMWLFDVFVLTFTAPFLVVYAFNGGVKERLGEFMTKALGVIFTPLILTITIPVACEISSFFHSTMADALSGTSGLMSAKALDAFHKTEWSMSNPLAGLGQLVASRVMQSVVMGLAFVVATLAETWLMWKIIVQAPGKFISYFTNAAHTSIETAGEIGQKASATKLT